MRRHRVYLPTGKLPEDILRKMVLTHVGGRRRDVVLWPEFGEDAGAVHLSSGIYILSIDPITGSREMVGWLAVHASANDVAVCGGRPTWFSPTILMPPKSTASDVGKIARQVERAANSIGVAIVTGHSEIAPYTLSPVVVGHMMGPLVARRLVTSSEAKVGDWILMSKWAGLEGTAIIATDFENTLKKKGVSSSDIRAARGYYRWISVVREALHLSATSTVNAMHDATEGGVLGGLYELAKASGMGFKVMADEIPVTQVTQRICRAMGLDPLRLVSSGVLLATTPTLNPRMLRRMGIKPIGRIVRRREGRLLIGRNSITQIDEPIRDELWKVLK
ncbi:MAG: AIR synthase family protein [Nitrososphaerota archaeon]